jgi:hypothetical protein
VVTASAVDRTQLKLGKGPARGPFSFFGPRGCASHLPEIEPKAANRRQEKPISTKGFEVTVEHDYRPVPELRHGANVLRKIAFENPKGSNWTRMGALLLYAFVVEGFCQTVGPDALGDVWTRDKRPAERFPVCDKLKAIGKAAGVGVDFAAEPWKTIKEVIRTRDRLAHPKPHKQLTVGSLDSFTLDYWVAGRELHNAEWNPLLTNEALVRISDAIDLGMTRIWEGLGNESQTLFMNGMTMTSASEKR